MSPQCILVVGVEDVQCYEEIARVAPIPARIVLPGLQFT
jgi:hypothetical protein